MFFKRFIICLITILIVLDRGTGENIEVDPIQESDIFTEETENPLIYSASNGDLENLAESIAAGHDVNVQNSVGWTPLIFAVEKGHIVAFKTLVEAGADINIAEQDGWHPLMFAAHHGDKIFVDYILANGGDPLLMNNRGFTSHAVAYNRGHKEVARSIANAVFADSIRVVKSHEGHKMMIIIQEGADPNYQNPQGWTPLITACANGWLDTVEFLLAFTRKDPETGGSYLATKVDLAENDGWTPLMFAANNGHANIVQLLLDHGADEQLRSIQGFTAYSLANKRGFYNVVGVIDKFLGNDNKGGAENNEENGEGGNIKPKR